MTPWTTACQASLSITNSHSLLKLMSFESMMPSSHLILCRPLLLLPSIFPSIRVLSNEIALRIRWPKYWSFSFSISPSNEYSGLISFRIDCGDIDQALTLPPSMFLPLNAGLTPETPPCSWFISWPITATLDDGPKSISSQDLPLGLQTHTFKSPLLAPPGCPETASHSANSTWNLDLLPSEP